MTTRTEQVQQVQVIREICRLMVERQEDYLRLISDALDTLEVSLFVSYAEESWGVGVVDGK
jgi:hypothetical protein